MKAVKKLERLAAEATPGPWVWNRDRQLLSPKLEPGPDEEVQVTVDATEGSSE